MLTRRDLMKLGIVVGGHALIRPGLARADGSSGDLPPSPPTTPFIQPLPVPPSPITVPPFVTPDCNNVVPLSPRYYQLIEEERLVQVHPQLPPTRVWGYRDVNQPSWPFVPGPTFVERANTALIVRQVNNLPTIHQGFGDPRTTVHLHGGHTESRSDGFPTLFFAPGQFYDYCYSLFDRGFSHGMPDPAERESTLWYHDHLIDFTGPNVYRGLAAFFLMFDELDTGNEATGLHLPTYPTFDIPLLIQDKRFDRNGQLVFNTFDHDGFLGDKFCVNGAIQPFLHVNRRKYRFRFLNGSNARIYQLYLVNAAGQKFRFDQIGNEGGLFAAPIRGIDNFQFSPAERVEIVVDFSQFPAGTAELFIENRLQQTNGRKPDELVANGPRLLKFILDGPAPDASQVPPVLRPFAATTQAELNAAVRRTFEFERNDGAWTINERFFDPNTPIVTPLEGQGQLWHLVNKSGGWFHPIHVHLDFMRVLSRNGALPPLAERDGIARKDAVILGPNDDVHVFLKFQDFPGPFTFHCHNLEHEDMAMMARFDAI
jgi:FtsP/CotA-like multicopper oxidase with cupredoxin domain